MVQDELDWTKNMVVETLYWTTADYLAIMYNIMCYLLLLLYVFAHI